MTRRNVVTLTLRKTWLAMILGLIVSAALIDTASAFVLLGTKWDPGQNSASAFTIAPGTPGAATWSIMPANLGLDPASQLNPASVLFDPDHNGPTTSLGALLGNINSTSEEIAIINAALNVWGSASGFTNLGMVTDGGAPGGASLGQNGHVGDIRIGAFPFAVNALGGTFRPSTELLSQQLSEGPGGTLGGDAHINNAVLWVDDSTDLFSDPDVDFFTIMLHELGHTLGLGHSTLTSAVMFPNYSGAKRTLTADDIAGIRAIYGVNTSAAVPEPETLVLIAIGIMLVIGQRVHPQRRLAS